MDIEKIKSRIFAEKKKYKSKISIQWHLIYITIICTLFYQTYQLRDIVSFNLSLVKECIASYESFVDRELELYADSPKTPPPKKDIPNAKDISKNHRQES